ncbi:MAG TPA: right-handed parallel beta-helix repeat-containing protein [Bacteroidales bacterium]|nr:right-handed parallel beta-helix repeat-containing protein [Bacteroidales bacterium]
MKKISYVFFIFAIIAFSCSKDGMLNDFQVVDQQVNKSLVKSVNTFRVSPNGTDDTQSIIDAFNQAKAAGPSSVVQLTPGTFRIGMITVQDFVGSFRGAGKGRTIITNLPNLPQADIWNAGIKYPALLKFVGGDLSMSDMTIHLADGPSVTNTDMIGDLYSILFLTSTKYNADDTQYTNTFIKASVDNVDFIAGYDGGIGFSLLGSSMYNVWSGIMFDTDTEWGQNPGLTKGDFSVTRCRFENEVFSGTWIWGADKTTKASFENNVYTGCPMQILLASCLGSEVNVKNNLFQNGSYCDLFIDNYNWLWVGSGALTQSAHFTVTGNNFQSPAGVTSLYMNDARRPVFPDEGFPQLFEVSNNSFNTQDSGMAVQSLNNVGARICNNRFSGTGKYGILVDGDEPSGTYAENITLPGNSFFKATYSDASIYLGAYTRNCKVVGYRTDKVINNGVDNIVIGLNPHRGFNYPAKNIMDKFRFGHDNLLLKRRQ